MARIVFPTNPTLNQTFTSNGKTWTWNGVSWESNTSNQTATNFTSPIVPFNNFVIFEQGGQFRRMSFDTFSQYYNLTPIAAPAWSPNASISGTATVGQNITISPGTIQRGEVSNTNILRNGTFVAAAVNNSYTVTNLDIGANISVQIVAIGLGGSNTFITNSIGPVIGSAAPILSSPTDIFSGSNGMTGTVNTNQGNGTLFWFVSTSSSPPSISALKAGTGAAAFGSQAVSSTGTQNISGSGLTPGTAYFTYYVHTNTLGNNSAIASADGFTTDSGSAMVSSGMFYSFSTDYTGVT